MVLYAAAQGAGKTNVCRCPACILDCRCFVRARNSHSLLAALPGLCASAGTSLRLCAYNQYMPELPSPQGVEAFFCTACKRHTTAIKTLRLHRLPRVLLLHIKVRCTWG